MRPLAAAVLALALPAASAAQPGRDLSGPRRLNAPGAPAAGLPPLTKVIVLSAGEEKGTVDAVWVRDGRVERGALPEAVVDPARASRAPSAAEEAAAALAEARENAALARRLDKGAAPQYTEYLARLDKRLACLEGKRAAVASSWPSFKERMREELTFDLRDKPAGLARFKALIFGVFDPTGSRGPLSATTMMIPLNKAWFLGDPRLKDYYDREFLGGRFDVRIEGGGSGEGVTLNEKDPDDSFTAYKKTLLKLRDFVAATKDAAISSSPEGRWLLGLSEESFAGIRRMIFVHEFTWDRIGGDRRWADYIPVDQSLPGLKPNYLLSVLIHEINVNSYDPSFLPADTHMPQTDTDAARASVAERGPGGLADAGALRAFLGVEPFLGSIYAGLYADRLAAAAAPVCR